MNNFKKREIFAYQFLNTKKVDFKKGVTLSELSKKINRLPNNNFFFELKINSILTIKWYFDYLNNYLESPKKIQNAIDHIYFIVNLFFNFYQSNWIKKNKINTFNFNKWDLTKKSFDFMWTETTKKKKDYELSKLIVEPRINQIIKMMPYRNFLKDKIVLDSGCGPGRYINCILKYKPKKIYGIDYGKKIIKKNRKKFTKKNIIFKQGDFSNLKFKNNFFDFIISAGVLHHSETSISKLILEHSRVLKKNGFMFVFIKSTGGLELKLWKFYRSIFKNIPINITEEFLREKINPLRLQGFLDHCYGVYKEISRKKFEKILKNNFSTIRRINGISGLDVTPELYKKDKFFKARFGDGDLRYLLKK